MEEKIGDQRIWKSSNRFLETADILTQLSTTSELGSTQVISWFIFLVHKDSFLSDDECSVM